MELIALDIETDGEPEDVIEGGWYSDWVGFEVVTYDEKWGIRREQASKMPDFFSGLALMYGLREFAGKLRGRTTRALIAVDFAPFPGDKRRLHPERHVDIARS